MSQTLQEYIDWYQTLAFEDMYDKYLELHDPAVPGFVLPGKVSIPTDLIKKIKHSLANPGVDLHQLLIACDDQVDGQVIGFHNPGNWNWKKGDILRINTWRSLHWTKNTSNKVRVIIKVTGIEFGMKKESNVIA